MISRYSHGNGNQHSGVYEKSDRDILSTMGPEWFLQRLTIDKCIRAVIIYVICGVDIRSEMPLNCHAFDMRDSLMKQDQALHHVGGIGRFYKSICPRDQVKCQVRMTRKVIAEFPTTLTWSKVGRQAAPPNHSSHSVCDQKRKAVQPANGSGTPCSPWVLAQRNRCECARVYIYIYMLFINLSIHLFIYVYLFIFTVFQ